MFSQNSPDFSHFLTTVTEMFTESHRYIKHTRKIIQNYQQTKVLIYN